MIALLLAQLVMPSPSVEPLSPPGMICMGECSDGPMVWRASPARGRLVVACDMRSDTCSDGRKITTKRASPVPCEVEPGVWEMVPENTACISYRGLEVWAANTSYLSYGAELDRSPWRKDSTRTTIEALPRGYRITGTASDSRALQGGISSIPGPHTLACVLRTDEPDLDPGTRTGLRIWWGSGPIIPVPVTSTWATYSITQTVPEDATDNTSAHVHSGVGTVDVIGCWLTRTDTPGRACWGGEAPVTCDADRHTISTEGWPTESGEICITANVESGAARNLWLIDGRGSGATGNTRLFVRSGTNALALLGPQGSIEGGVVAAGPRRLCVRASDGTARLTIDGVVVAQGAMLAPMAWFPMATIGSAYPAADGSEINGSIYSLRIRSFE